MTLPDIVNGGFEFGGGIFLLRNCYKLYLDKKVRGVSVWVTAFFTVWGVWNLYYYPALGQWASFAGGLMIVASNGLWVGMAFHYLRKERENGEKQEND